MKRVLGVLMVAENSLADTPDHRTVASHESFEGPFVVLANVAIEKLDVLKSSERSGDEKGPKLANNALTPVHIHRASPVRENRSRLYSFIARSRPNSYRLTIFFKVDAT